MADEVDESAGDGYSGCDLSTLPSAALGGGGPALTRSSLARRSSVGSSSLGVRAATSVAGDETEETGAWEVRLEEFSR